MILSLALLAVSLFLFLNRLSRFKRTVDDVSAFQMKVDLAEIEELLNPVVDLQMRFPYLYKQELKQLILATESLKPLHSHLDEKGFDDWVVSLMKGPIEDMRMTLQFFDDQRRDQRIRMETLRDRLLRMLHNATIQRDWVKTHLADSRKVGCTYDEEMDAILNLDKAASRFLFCVRIILCRMWLWRVIAFESRAYLPIPGIGGLKAAWNIDILEAYGELKKAAFAMGEICSGPEGAEEIVLSM